MDVWLRFIYSRLRLCNYYFILLGPSVDLLFIISSPSLLFTVAWKKTLLVRNLTFDGYSILDGLYLSSYLPISNPFTKLLVSAPSAPITVGITDSLMFKSLFIFCSQAMSRYLSLFLIHFNFTLWTGRTANSTIRQALFFVYYHKECSSSREWEIAWNLKIRE